MRNLKRALSLVLAAAMLIGMMVVGASAVSYNDFSDRGEIVNKDAVSMLTTLEIIQGQPDGSYNPSGNVDRAQMAKMISVMLTNNQNCDTLYTNVDSGLTDIAANWARGFINYCYVRGIIAGRGDNTFDPSANVTGVEAAKMLLAALGYNAEIEGLVGPDWALNTAALAQQLGIFRNFTKDVSEPLNRDDAALLIYNALDVELIQEYRNGYAISYDDHRTVLSSVFGVMRVEGIVVANEWAALDGEGSETALREGRTTLDNVVVYDSTTANTVVEEGVRQDGEVPFNVTTPVEYLGKAVTMYIEKTTVLSNSKVIGVATKDDMNVIHFTADGADTVKDYLKGTGVAVSDTETDYYLNYGYMDDAEAAIDWINDYAVEDSKGNDFALNGVEVEVIDNDDDGTAEYVLYLQETMSEVNRVNASNETVAFYTPDRDTRSMLDGTTSVTTVDLEDVVYADSVSLEGVATTDTIELAAEDLILYVQYGGRTYVYLPEYVTGTMTRIDRDQSNEQYITLDNGETYYQSYIIDAASMVDVDLTRFFVARAREDVGFDTMYDFILDSHGYVVAVRPAEEVVTNYALVLDSAWTQNALRYGGQVEVLMADGTTETYDINWNESRKAFDGIRIEIDGKAGYTGSELASANSNSALNDKLEAYLGSRDVVIDGVNPDKGDYATGAAAGSIITYSLNEAGDELTIESVLQGNNFEDDTEKNQDESLEIETDSITTSTTGVDLETTAGVGDNTAIIYMDGEPNGADDNLQYETNAAYTNGSGEISVRPSNYDDGVEDMALRNQPKTYAVDQNTVAFYYYKTTDGYVYGVATGWEDMISVDRGVDVQVYPALRKTSNHTYVASDLAAVILFEVEPAALSDDYMLVLSANALGKDTLELTVVFEDGTVDAITIDDQGDFDEDRDNHFMKAWSYTENEDGTYDIGSMWSPWGVADLLRVGTIDLRAFGENGAHKYLSLPSDANVWDVTETKTSGDEVAVGHYQENVLVNTVAITDAKGQVRTAWMWDYDGTTDGNIDYNFTWTLDNYVEIYAYEPVFMQQMKLAQAYSNDQNVMYIGNLALDGNVITGDLYIPEGMIFQIEGNLTENGTNGVVGGGTLRVAGTYTVSNDNGDGLYESAITVNTQVGRDNTDDLILRGNTEIDSRVGVNGDVGDLSYRGTLTIDGSLFANGNVYVPGGNLIVNGHVEADNYHIHNGVVNSSNTLIALGDICLHDDALGTPGTLTIGNGTNRGVVYVYGDIVDGHSAGDVGNVIVDNGVLYLGFESEIALDQTSGTGGDVKVYANGAIEQEMGYINGITADDVTINGGDVTLSGTINANTLNLWNGADVTVVGNPSPYTGEDGYDEDTTSTIEVLAGTDVEEPNVPTTGLEITNLEIKGAKVTLDQTTKTGTVTLSDSQANNTGSYTGAAELVYEILNQLPSGTTVKVLDPSGTEVKATATDVVTADTYQFIVTKGGASAVYNITVTIASKSTNANVSGITVKGKPATVNVSDPTKYTVSLTWEEANSTSTEQILVATSDVNATWTVEGAKKDNKSPVTAGTITVTVTPEAGAGDANVNNVKYTIQLTVGAKPATDANVKLALVDEDAANELTGSGHNWTLTVPDKDYFGDGSWLAQVIKVTSDSVTSSTIDMNTAKETTTGTTEDVWTLTFQGIDGDGGVKGEPYVITLTVTEPTAAEKLQNDLDAAVKAVQERTFAYSGAEGELGMSFILTDASDGVEAQAKVAIGDLDWSDASLSVTASHTGDWEPPTNVDGNKTVTVSVTITLSDGQSNPVSQTVQVPVTVTKTA